MCHRRSEEVQGEEGQGRAPKAAREEEEETPEEEKEGQGSRFGRRRRESLLDLI